LKVKNRGQWHIEGEDTWAESIFDDIGGIFIGWCATGAAWAVVECRKAKMRRARMEVRESGERDGMVKTSGVHAGDDFEEHW
jgi:hypothetical protein